MSAYHWSKYRAERRSGRALSASSSGHSAGRGQCACRAMLRRAPGVDMGCSASRGRSSPCTPGESRLRRPVMGRSPRSDVGPNWRPDMRVMVVNAGSSSMKVDLVHSGRTVSSFDGLPAIAPKVDAVGTASCTAGGSGRSRGGRREDRAAAAASWWAGAVAPTQSLRGLDAAARMLPHVPHVACSTPRSTPPAARREVALPKPGGSAGACAATASTGCRTPGSPARRGRWSPSARRVVTCHLGAGASLAAVLDGASVDTTMGSTPLDGLVMATRSGAVDPGLLHLAWVKTPKASPRTRSHTASNTTRACSVWPAHPICVSCCARHGSRCRAGAGGLPTPPGPAASPP